MVTNMLPSLFFLLLVSITPDPTGTRVRDTSHTSDTLKKRHHSLVILILILILIICIAYHTLRAGEWRKMI